jgi:ubiquinone/menaquinone biosynthesis C-methylase UbiE
MGYLVDLYEDSAEKYEELLVQQRFKRPAIDLINAINPSIGNYILDIGTGTGAALFPILEKIGSQGVVVGLDPSTDMLKIAQEKGASLLIEGQIPGFSFMKNTFDAISASFVLSHMKSYKDGLNEIYNILKPGGTFGATTWREGQEEYNSIWNGVTKNYINQTVLKEMNHEQIPWETWFEKIENINESFEDANFESIEIVIKEYALEMTLNDYLACRYTLLGGKFVQRSLSDNLFKEFQQEMYDAFWSVCGDSIIYEGRVNIIIAKKPVNEKI